MIGELQKLVSALKEKPEYQPLLERFGSELHDIFESVLTTALIENSGEKIDGATILATLMKIFKQVAQPPDQYTTIVPPIKGLPSERYGRPDRNP